MAIAAVIGRYEGTMEMQDLAPRTPTARHRGRGKPSFVNDGVAIAIRHAGGATEVAAEGTGQVPGTITRVGQRLLGSVSKMMMDRSSPARRSGCGKPRPTASESARLWQTMAP